MDTRHAIEERTEDAISAYLKANLGDSAASELPLTVGFPDNADIEPDGIRVTAPQCVEVQPDCGTYNVEVDVKIATTEGAVDRAGHAEMVGAVMDLFYNDELLANLASAAAAQGVTQWTCLLVTKGLRSRRMDGSQRIFTQRLTLEVVPN